MAEQKPTIEIPEDLLLSDDMMPNDGGVFDVGEFVDDEAVAADKKVKTMVNGAAPMINVLLDWLNADIETASQIENVNLESKVPAESQIIAQKQIKVKLNTIKQTLINMADAHGVKYSQKKAKMM